MAGFRAKVVADDAASHGKVCTFYIAETNSPGQFDFPHIAHCQPDQKQQSLSLPDLILTQVWQMGQSLTKLFFSEDG